MSWIEKIKDDFTIKMGDGKEYKVNWLNATRATEFNTALFNFKGVKGTLVKRGTPQGTIYNLEMYLQGANNLADSQNFKNSAEDPNVWSIQHPMYGGLAVQPLSLAYDDSNYNVTKITGQIIEVTDPKFVKTGIAPAELIKAKKLDTDATFAQSIISEVPVPDSGFVSQMHENADGVYTLQKAFASAVDDAEAVRNAYNAANAAIDDAISNVSDAITTTQYFLSLPANFTNSIINRINFLKSCFEDLSAQANSLHFVTPSLKRLYENNAACTITTICTTTVTNVSDTDYANRTDVITIIDVVITAYNDYVTILDGLQTDTGATPDSYVPNFDSLWELTQIVNYTISNLFNVINGARQQRFYTLETDSNLILLANTLYGLQEDDSTITQLINDNSITLDEYLTIKKGRVITYYI